MSAIGIVNKIGTRLSPRRLAIALAAVLIAGSGSVAMAEAAPQWGWAHWVGTWAAPQQAPGSTPAEPPNFPGPFENQTIRQIIHLSIGGERMRLKFSNLFGTQTLVIGEAHVARFAGGASIDPRSDRLLRFGGKTGVSVPVGTEVMTDPVDFFVPALADLAVTVYVPTNTGQPSFHDDGLQTAYISGPGNFAGAQTLPATQTSTSRYWLAGVEVMTLGRVGAVVTFGGAVTDGNGSTVDTNHRWPDLLSARLNSEDRARGDDGFRSSRVSVINGGLACNRLIRDFCGPSALSRFDRDALDQKGVTHVIVDLGLLDIVLPTFLQLPGQDASPEEITGALEQLAERAHAAHLKVYSSTLTPVGNAIVPGFFTPENEAKRQAVNQWIRTSHVFDAVIDFDKILRDPNHPEDLALIYDNGSGIEVNDAGAQAIADSINLEMLRRHADED